MKKLQFSVSIISLFLVYYGNTKLKFLLIIYPIAVVIEHLTEVPNNLGL